MLGVLIEEERLDVNQTDRDGKMPNHRGTPIIYAAKERGAMDVVRYLLAKGADPTVRIAGANTMRLIRRSSSGMWMWHGCCRSRHFILTTTRKLSPSPVGT